MDRLPDNGIDVNTGKPARTSAGRFMGMNVIYGSDREHATPYMTRFWIGRLRLHIFHRGDQDPDCHDHPWGFWTFPFRSYVEEVVEHAEEYRDCEGNVVPGGYWKRRQIVRAWRWSYRPAIHTHRVIGPYAGMEETGDTDYPFRDVPVTKPGTIPTLVWRERPSRKWGFLKSRDGRWCWVHWKEYVFAGGKDAPCSEPDYMRLSAEDYEAIFGPGSSE